MPPVPTVDTSADSRVTERRTLKVRHLVMGLVLVVLYVVTMLLAWDSDGAGCPGGAGGAGGGCVGTARP